MFLKNTTNLEPIKDVLQLYNSCPYCRSPLIFKKTRNAIITTSDDSDFDYDSICYGDTNPIYEYRYHPTIRMKIEFKLDGLSVCINLDTRELTFTIHQNEPQTVYSGTVLRYFGSMKMCDDCTKFSYTIQHIVTTKNREVDVVSTLKEINIVHDNYIITQCYDTKKTELQVFEQDNGEGNSGSTYTLDIPLLDLNLKNPEATVERIKKLHLFS